MISSSNKFLALLLVFICFGASGPGLQAQGCTFHIDGVVKDLHTGKPMPYVTVYERSLGRGFTTDEAGRFYADSLCRGDVHLEFRHVGCEPVEQFLHLRADTNLVVILHHNAKLLGEVQVRGGRGDMYQVGIESIGQSEIDARSDEDLTSLLKDITGLSAIQNGSSLAKPVYHGMSGNRLTILNNGIAQSGQSWGSDHAPEIDPFSVSRLSVIQGVHTLAQNGPNLGGMILLEMEPIGHDPHLHGQVNYSFISNGAGHSLSSRLQKSGKWAAWRMNVSAKMIGDRETPDYYLTNTANQQLNGSLLIEKEPSLRWKSSLYLSTFNTDIGVMRGSHIGSVNDLTEAFLREVPFYTESSRSHDLANPRQAVGHHLVKFKNSIRSDIGYIDITYAGQLNNRKEFDIRRGDRENKAALDLSQVDHFLETSFRFRSDSAFSWKTGLQYRYTRNVNDPNTGILPLVPDYLNQKASAYIIAEWKMRQWRVSAGGRHDVHNVYALPISDDFPRVIERKDLWYANPSAVVTLRYDFTEEFILEGEGGYRQRSPEVNELFSNGLHQGVSGIEEGDENLLSETGYMTRLNASYHIKEKYFFTASVYQNRIDNFIYLVPQNELRLTIRGAFPVFKYQQVNAHMRGIDLTVAVELGEQWRLRSSYSILKGMDRDGDLALVGIPANSGDMRVQYEIENWKGLHDIHVGANYTHTAARTDLLTDNSTFTDRPEDSPLLGQDFLAPPPAYGLVSVDMSALKHVGKKTLKMGVSVDNLLNTRYRDYLDRQRYFADAMGRNMKLKVAWEF